MTTKIAIALLLLTWTQSPKAQNTVIKAGHFFDARSGKMLLDQVIIIQNGKIKEVGAGLPIEQADTVIDLSNSWVLPGLMDCHVHITSNLSYRTRNWNEVDVTESSSLRAIRGSIVAKQFLDNGFTTIKEIGNDANYVSADIIKAIKMGWIQGPTIVYAGKIIAPFGGQSYNINPEHGNLWTWEYIDADTPEEIIKAIRKNLYYGATVIKMETGDNGIYDSADIKVAVTEAKKYGLKVTVHVKLGGQEATNVILGGAAAIEHGFGLNNTQLKLMKDRGIFLVGTDFSFDNWYAYGMDSAAAKAWVNIDIDRLKRAYAIGTKMAFGTDIVVNLPGLNRVQSNLKVLNSWKAAGIPPAYILQCMTKNAAELLGLDKERGSLERSYYADIIALRNDPLIDIEAIKTIHFVMKEGKVIRHN